MDSDEFEIGQDVFLMNSGQWGTISEIDHSDNSLLIELGGITRWVYAWDVWPDDEEEA